MKYTVVWLKPAEDELAELWLGASDREAVSRAAREFDYVLQRDPENVGESREEGRIVLIPPLGATFEILMQDRLVRVLEVWRFTTHG